MTHKRAPHQGSRTQVLLRQLALGPGTFYQICELADCDIESDHTDHTQRALFEELIGGHHAHQADNIYHITTTARAAIAPPAPYIGQVAGPAYRGAYYPSQARIVRAIGCSTVRQGRRSVVAAP